MTDSSEMRPTGKLCQTSADVISRINERVADDDNIFMFDVEVLVTVLDYDSVLPFIARGSTSREEWELQRCLDVEGAALSYLLFAFGKAIDHRGLSASRSVDKMREYAWLLGRDDVVDAMDRAEYAQYGVPKLVAFAEGVGWSWRDKFDEDDVAVLSRMAVGDLCVDDCGSGCGQ